MAIKYGCPPNCMLEFFSTKHLSGQPHCYGGVNLEMYCH